MEKTAVQKLAGVLRLLVWIIFLLNLFCLLLVPGFAGLVAEREWDSMLAYLREELGNLIAWVVIGSIFLMICVGIGCLRSCEGKLRTCLFWDTVVFLAALVLHFGGNLALGFFGLAWRSLPGRILPTVLLGSSLTWILLALCCFWSWGDFDLYKTVVGLFATVAFLCVLWMGLFIVGFLYSREERIVEHQGRTFVEECDSFPNESYMYYEYHSPLVRGSKEFYGLGRYGSLTGSEEWPIND